MYNTIYVYIYYNRYRTKRTSEYLHPQMHSTETYIMAEKKERMPRRLYRGFRVRNGKKIGGERNGKERQKRRLIEERLSL